MLKECFQREVPEAGCDEAGRGCLAGPVFAAAVILPPGFAHPLLNDSKKMSEKNRYLMRDVILRDAVAWAVAEVSPEEIDRINILNASFAGMSRAVERLSFRPGLLLIDGNRFRSTLGIPFECIVGGDGLYASIAAASVLAKTFRDDRMKLLHEEYPQYGWNANKGYPTRQHRLAVLRYGLTPHHRLTFHWCARSAIAVLTLLPVSAAESFVLFAPASLRFCAVFICFFCAASRFVCFVEALSAVSGSGAERCAGRSSGVLSVG